MSLKAKCKLFKADLHNMTPEVMAQAGKNVEAIVEGCGMVLGDPARAQREGKTCVTAHNYRAGGCMQAPGGRCADIRPSERSVAIEIDAIVDWHEGCRGLDVCGRIAACADAKKDLECAYDMAHLSMSSTARGGTAANMSTNLMHSCNSLLTAGWYGEEPSQEVLFAAYDHVAADRKEGHRPSSEYNSAAGYFAGADGAHMWASRWRRSRAAGTPSRCSTSALTRPLPRRGSPSRAAIILVQPKRRARPLTASASRSLAPIAARRHASTNTRRQRRRCCSWANHCASRRRRQACSSTEMQVHRLYRSHTGPHSLL